MENFNTNTLFICIAAVAGIIFLFINAKKMMAKFLPESSLKGFSGIAELFSCFSRAIKIIKEQKLLVLLPVVLPLLTSIIFTWAPTIYRMINNPADFERARNTLQHIPAFWTRCSSMLSWVRIFRVIQNSVNYLDYGFYGCIGKGVIGIIVFLGIRWCVSKKYRLNIDKENKRNFGIVRSSLIAGLFIAGVFMSLFYSGSDILEPAKSLLLMTVVVTISQLLITPTICFFQGIFLFMLRDSFMKQKFSVNDAANGSLRVLWSLASINYVFLIFGGAMITQVYLAFYNQINSGNGWAYAFSLIFLVLGLLIKMALFAVPLFVVFYDTSFKEAALMQYRFITNNTVKYLQFVAFGVSVFFIISQAYNIFSYGNLKLSIQGLFLNEIATAGFTVLAVIFYIGFTHFLIDNEERKLLAENRAVPQPNFP